MKQAKASHLKVVVNIIIAFAMLRQLHETVVAVVVNFICIYDMLCLRIVVNPWIDDG